MISKEQLTLISGVASNFCPSSGPLFGRAARPFDPRAVNIEIATRWCKKKKSRYYAYKFPKMLLSRPFRQRKM
jgi:hypothetical protein